MTRRLTRFAACMTVILLAPACASEDASGGDGAGSVGRRRLTVYAAASLREVFTGMEDGFERSHPGIDLVLSFGASSTLARQVAEGAPADVLVAADEQSLAPLVADGVVREPTAVASNRLAVIVERGNPTGVHALRDLAAGGRTVILCAAEVPCGRLGAAWLRAAGVVVEPASLEPNVGGVVAKVALGEADAGLAYRTDATPGSGVEVAPVDEDDLTDRPDLRARYVAAAIGASTPSAEAWLAHLRSDEGRRALLAAGFGPP